MNIGILAVDSNLDRANLPQSCVGRDYDMFKM